MGADSIFFLPRTLRRQCAHAAPSPAPAPPAAGYFIDAPIWNQPSKYNFRDEFISGDAIWQSVGAGSLNHACLAAYPTEGWRCYFPEIHTPYLKTPWHVMMAAYDVASTSMIIGLCSPPSPCTPAELEALQLWRFTFIGQLAYGLDSFPGNGAYIDSCIVHEQNVDVRLPFWPASLSLGDQP